MRLPLPHQPQLQQQQKQKRDSQTKAPPGLGMGGSQPSRAPKLEYFGRWSGLALPDLEASQGALTHSHRSPYTLAHSLARLLNYKRSPIQVTRRTHTLTGRAPTQSQSVAEQ